MNISLSSKITFKKLNEDHPITRFPLPAILGLLKGWRFRGHRTSLRSSYDLKNGYHNRIPSLITTMRSHFKHSDIEIQHFYWGENTNILYLKNNRKGEGGPTEGILKDFHQDSNQWNNLSTGPA